MPGPIDSIQQNLLDYADALSTEALAPDAIASAKARLLDVLSAVITGFPDDPARIARTLCARMPQPDGASVLGTGMRASADMAAFANAAAASRVSGGGGPANEFVLPVLAAAEQAGTSGRDLVVALVLAASVYDRLSGVLQNHALFGAANIVTIASALAAGRLFGLSRTELAQSISLAAVTDTLLDARQHDHSMWDRFAAGAAGRAGLFATFSAREGMEGPLLPFEGKTGWSDLVAGGRFTLKGPWTGSLRGDIAGAEAGFRIAAGGALGSEQIETFLEHILTIETRGDIRFTSGLILN